MSIGGKIWVGVIGLGIALMGAIIMGFGEFVTNDVTQATFNLKPFGLVFIGVGATIVLMSTFFVAVKMWRMEFSTKWVKSNRFLTKEEILEGQDEK